MNLGQLYYFRTIAELERYTRAMEELYVSQSNLSHAIQELEEELNVKLLLRKGRNIKLTEYGGLLLPYVQRTIETLESGTSILKNYINLNFGTVTITSLPSLARFVPDIVICYVSETNRMNVHFQFEQESFYSLQEKLLIGKVDSLLSAKAKNPQAECLHLGTHQSILLVLQEHRLAQQKSVDLKELDHENFIDFDEMSQLHHQNREILQELGIGPNIVTETPQGVIVHSPAVAQRGVAIIPYPLDGTLHNTKVPPISNKMFQRDTYLMWDKNRYVSPTAECFRDLLIRGGKMFDQFLARNDPSTT